MAHQHSVYDTDKHFKIDPITREIINQTPEKIQLIQGDHNSERFTFEIARVEGHAMSQCNKIEVHFLNVAADKTGQSADVYLVEDMQISPDSNDVIIFSWLISGNATKFAGTLNFIVRFSCLTGETIDYVWNTGIFKGIGVGEGMSNSEGVIAEFSDVLEAWRQDLFEAGGDSVANVNMAREAALTAIQEEKATQVVAIEEKGAEVLAAIPEEYGALNANVEANAADIADLQKAGEKHSSLISRDDKRITTLEAAVYGDLAQMVVDNTAAHIKDVPTDARGTARIGMVGGMTRKCTNLCKPLPATYKDHGYTVTKNDDGSVTISGAATTAGDVILNIADSDNITLDAGKEYALKMYKDGVATYVSIRINYTDEAGGTSWGWSNQDTSRPRKVAKVYLQKTCEVGDTSLNGTYKVMLNEGSTVLPYEPYFEGLRSAPVTEVESVGANLIPFPYYDGGVGTVKEMNGVTFTVNKDGSITINGTPTNTAFFRLCTGIEWASASVSAETTAKTSDGKTFYNCRYNNTNTLLTINIVVGTTYNNAVMYPMVNAGSTALPYAPYVRHSLTIPEAVQALGGYGEGVSESVYNYIDYEKKQFVKRVGYVDMGSLGWKLNSENDLSLYRAEVSDMKIAPTYSEKASGILCGKYSISTQLANADIDDKSMLRAADAGRIWLRDTDFTGDVSTLKTALSGVMLYYELATPEVIDISDILSVDNYIEVEGNGSLTFKNEYKYDVPSEVTFVTKGVSE